MKLLKFFTINFLSAALMVSFFSTALASTTDGTIDSTYRSALLCVNDDCTITSQINFKPTLGTPIHVTDTNVTGNAWSENFGWINLNPTHGGVLNNSDGILSGYAWGDGAGWINFKPTMGGVTINTSGQFTGYAWSENFGWIKFNCNIANACVVTDWRPSSARNDYSSSGSSAPVSTTIVEPITPPTHITEDNFPKKEKDMNIPPVVDPVTPPMAIEPTSPPVVVPIEKIDTNKPLANNSKNSVLGSGSVVDYINSVIFNFINQSGIVFIDSLEKTKIIIKELSKNIVSIIETPVGDVSTKFIATTGLISGAYISVTTVLFSNPLTFSEFFLIPMRLWGLLLIAFGIKKRNLPWGTVYDSVTKQPLDPVYVILQDLYGKEVATSITDIDGRYGFLVPAGSYKLIANKTNYLFPSIKLANKNNDTIYNDLYFSEVIEVKEGEVITKNIPMDPLKFDWNEFAKNDQKLMRFFSKREVWIARISDILFILGFILSIAAILVSPVIYNKIIFIVYIILFVLKKTILKPRSFGRIEYRDTKVPLAYAVLRVLFANTENEVIHKITDKAGKYYCLTPNGLYYVKIENKNPDESYSLVHTSEPIEVKNGYINNKFEV